MWGKVYKSSELKSGCEHHPGRARRAGDVSLYGQSKDESEPLWLSQWFLPTWRAQNLGEPHPLLKDPLPYSPPTQHTLQASLIWSYHDSDALLTLRLPSSLRPSMPDALIYLTHRAPFSETQSAPQTYLQIFISPSHHPHSLPGPTPLSHVPPHQKSIPKSRNSCPSSGKEPENAQVKGHLAVFQCKPRLNAKPEDEALSRTWVDHGWTEQHELFHCHMINWKPSPSNSGCGSDLRTSLKIALQKDSVFILWSCGSSGETDITLSVPSSSQLPTQRPHYQRGLPRPPWAMSHPPPCCYGVLHNSSTSWEIRCMCAC